jgi:hypothetical protein
MIEPDTVDAGAVEAGDRYLPTLLFWFFVSLLYPDRVTCKLIDRWVREAGEGSWLRFRLRLRLLVPEKDDQSKKSTRMFWMSPV